MSQRITALLSCLPLIVIAAACQGPPGPAGPQGPAGPPGSGTAPQVVDSTAPTPQVVGEYLHSADVKITAGGHTFGLGAQRTRLFGRVELYFTGANCTSTAFILAAGAWENLLLIAAVDQAQMAHIPNPAAPVSNFTQTSKVDNTGTCVGAGGGSMQGKPAIPVLDLSTFVVPFSLG